jgi:rhodanese-related sulfurtransferase
MFKRMAKRGLTVAKKIAGAGKGIIVGGPGVGYGVGEFSDFEKMRSEAAAQDALEGNVTAGSEFDVVAEGTVEISAEDLRVLLEVEAVEDHPTLLDVRQNHEWKSGHLPGAVHVPLAVLESRVADLDTERPIVTYCGSGMRSIDASYVLKREGRYDVRSLAGGITAWKQANNPVVVPD